MGASTVARVASVLSSKLLYRWTIPYSEMLKLWNSFYETSPGGYNFNGKMWRTSDGCHNIDFLGSLGSGHGFCCGSLPCDFST